MLNQERDMQLELLNAYAGNEEERMSRRWSFLYALGGVMQGAVDVCFVLSE